MGAVASAAGAIGPEEPGVNGGACGVDGGAVGRAAGAVRVTARCTGTGASVRTTPTDSGGAAAGPPRGALLAGGAGSGAPRGERRRAGAGVEVADGVGELAGDAGAVRVTARCTGAVRAGLGIGGVAAGTDAAEVRAAGPVTTASSGFRDTGAPSPARGAEALRCTGVPWPADRAGSAGGVRSAPGSGRWTGAAAGVLPAAGAGSVRCCSGSRPDATEESRETSAARPSLRGATGPTGAPGAVRGPGAGRASASGREPDAWTRCTGAAEGAPVRGWVSEVAELA
ncbi:hypothetical protein ACIO3O_14625 [Streptomyces sp. NPDC087440]|uniref:hypothetical protein n=1 Tax=Streptomyces sp. NPDC087440 TaxID=3365790 RepID=UPI0038175FB7